MKKHLLSALAFAALLTGATAPLPTADAKPAAPDGRVAQLQAVSVCAARPRPGFAACQAIVMATSEGTPLTTAQPGGRGYSPDDIQDAYQLAGLESGGRTVAIVDAYGYSRLEEDLALYRSTYGLPPCTTDNGCLTIMDQRGGTDYPPNNGDWDLEQALDVDAVSATCPDCKILVVQADNANLRNLGIAVNRAARQKGVVAISNSYLGRDRKALDYYDHPGIAVTVATGNDGYQGGAYPSDDPHVVAVSGTTLVRNAQTKRGWTERAWARTGSGCAESNRMPKWQKDAKTTCRKRAIGDVSAAADPGQGGLEICYHGRFQRVGGTSEATPIIAAVFALSGRTGGYPARFPYRSPKHLYDITRGSNGRCGRPICEARKGWDGPTGVGTPQGVKGF
jgi:subtilase family serine protease